MADFEVVVLCSIMFLNTFYREVEDYLEEEGVLSEIIARAL